MRDSQDMQSSKKSCIFQKLVFSDPYKIYYSPGLLSANPGVLLLLMGELVRRKIDSALNYKHQQVSLKRLKTAFAARVQVLGNKREYPNLPAL